jgi:hypothetical protein
MAVFTGSGFGDISGVLKDYPEYIAYKRNGKNILSRKPEPVFKFTTAQISHTLKFKSAVDIAGRVKPVIKYSFNYSSGFGGFHNNFLKKQENYFHISNEKFSPLIFSVGFLEGIKNLRVFRYDRPNNRIILRWSAETSWTGQHSDRIFFISLYYRLINKYKYEYNIRTEYNINRIRGDESLVWNFPTLPAARYVTLWGFAVQDRNKPFEGYSPTQNIVIP